MKAGSTGTTTRRRGGWLLAVAALVILVDHPSVVAAQTPPSTLPPVLAPAGSNACSLGGLTLVIVSAAAGQAGLDLSGLKPVDEVVVNACASLPAPAETVTCSVDNELANVVAGVPLPVAVPVPLPSPTPFGTTVETMQGLALMLQQSPDSLDFVGSFLGCKTITGPPGSGSSAPTAPTEAPSIDAPATEAPVTPSGDAAPTGGGGYTSHVASGPAASTAPQVAEPTPVSSTFASVPGPFGAPAANASLILLALALVISSSYAWRRAGRDAQTLVDR